MADFCQFRSSLLPCLGRTAAYAVDLDRQQIESHRSAAIHSAIGSAEGSTNRRDAAGFAVATQPTRRASETRRAETLMGIRYSAPPQPVLRLCQLAARRRQLRPIASTHRWSFDAHITAMDATLADGVTSSITARTPPGLDEAAAQIGLRVSQGATEIFMESPVAHNSL